MKTSFAITGALALALAACGGGGETETEEAAADPVDTMLPGAFAITTEVTSLDSTDGGEPATNAEMGGTTTTNVCVGEDGLLPAAAFGEDGDNCTVENPYIRRGKVRQTLVCQRDGASGQIRLQVDAEFTGETLDGTVRSSTFFADDGDYSMTRTISAQRTGDCTAAEADEDLEAEVAE